MRSTALCIAHRPGPSFTFPLNSQKSEPTDAFMFSKLPQKIPFNLLGDEAKLAFRSQGGGITKLATTRVSEALASAMAW